MKLADIATKTISTLLLFMLFVATIGLLSVPLAIVIWLMRGVF